MIDNEMIDNEMIDNEMGPRTKRRVASLFTGERSRVVAWAGRVRAWGFRAAMATALVVGVASEGSAGFELALTADDIIDPPGASGTTGKVDADAIVTQINLNDGYKDYYTGVNDNESADFPGVTAANLGTMLFKWEQGSREEDLPLMGSYEIVELMSDGKAGGTIQYTGSGDIVDPLSPSWLVVKDGNAGFVVYDLFKELFDPGSFAVNWDGKMDLTFTNAGLIDDKNNLKDISHIQIWGGSAVPKPTGGPVTVPEPGTFAIWGLSLLGCVGVIRRRRQ